MKDYKDLKHKVKMKTPTKINNSCLAENIQVSSNVINGNDIILIMSVLGVNIFYTG